MRNEHEEKGGRGAIVSLLILLVAAFISGLAGAAEPPQLSLPAHTLAVGDKTLAYFSMGAGPSVVIVHGNSVGAWVTATVAATYQSRVHRLILIDAAGFKAMFEGPPPLNFDPSNAEEMQKLINITINSDVGKTPGLAERAYDGYVASGEKAISATWNKSLFQSPRLEEQFPKITAPTLVLWGADDKLFPSALAGALSSQIAGSQKQLIPNAGHFPQIDNPTATTAAIVDFLK